MTWVAAPRKTTRSTMAGTRFSPADPCASIRTRSGLITACAGPPAASHRCEVSAKSPSRSAPAPATDLDLHQVGRAEEVGHVGVRGLLVDLARGADLHDPARVHHRQPVGHGQRLLLVVGDVEEGDADAFLQRLQLDLERAAQLGVERAERLVEQQHGRVEHERAGQRDPLLLAAGQLARPPLGERGHLDQVEASSTRRFSSALPTARCRSPNATLSKTSRNGNSA